MKATKKAEKIQRKEQSEFAKKAAQAELTHRQLAENSAKAILSSENSTFAERNRAKIILKRIQKGKALKVKA